MVTTRFQKTREAKRKANKNSWLHKLPTELLLIICQLLGLSPREKTIHLYLRRQPALCARTHPSRCSLGHIFPERVRGYTSPCLTTVWHLMQAASFLRDFVRPLYMARTAHLICGHQLSAYQQSPFCNNELKPFRHLTIIYVNNLFAPLAPLMNCGFYKMRIEVEVEYEEYESNCRRVRKFGGNLFRLIQLRDELWMDSLLQRVKDLWLDLRGDIRLIPDPRYFAAHPDLSDLMTELEQLRGRSQAGVYVLLLPRRRNNENRSIHKISLDELAHHCWKKGAQLGRIQKVFYRNAFEWNRHFDVIPTKEFIANRCDLWEVVGEDVEEDGFECRDSGGAEDEDWEPTSMEQGTSSEGHESDDSDADDVVDWKREKLRRHAREVDINIWEAKGHEWYNGIKENAAWEGEVDAAWEGEAKEDAVWKSLENMVVNGEYEENESNLVTSRAVLEAESKIWLPTLLRKGYGGIGLEVPTV
ncbi:hypothetical protein LA080_011850 [Diaporthe eres]|nr:hypothetical protein LA080_011850 [Diaporthe eres]